MSLQFVVSTHEVQKNERRQKQRSKSGQGFDTLAPNHFESLGIRELMASSTMALVPDNP